MKSAIYIEDNAVQLVLTPEDEFEQNILRSLERKTLQTTINIGTFYGCTGGWVIYNRGPGDWSLIIRSEAKVR